MTVCHVSFHVHETYDRSWTSHIRPLFKMVFRRGILFLQIWWVRVIADILRTIWSVKLVEEDESSLLLLN